jgi:hypothetical protein
MTPAEKRHAARWRRARRLKLADPTADREWGERMEGALLLAVERLTDIASVPQRRVNRVRGLRDELLGLVDSIEDARHGRGFCGGPDECVHCDAEAEEIDA